MVGEFNAILTCFLSSPHSVTSEGRYFIITAGNCWCCSDLCDRQSDSHDRDACSEECVAPGYCQAQYGSETACIGMDPTEQSIFDRSVSFDESAVHIPVNIFENGKRGTSACEAVVEHSIAVCN